MEESQTQTQPLVPFFPYSHATQWTSRKRRCVEVAYTLDKEHMARSKNGHNSHNKVSP